MSTYDIISVIVGLILIATVIVLCVMNERKDKAKELIYKLLRQVMTYVDEAERMFGSGKGEAKLDYVMTKVQLDCANYKIKISLPSIIDYIEQVLQTPSVRQSKTTVQPNQNTQPRVNPIQSNIQGNNLVN